MAITSRDSRDHGQPSSWSTAVDQLCANVEDAAGGRLMVLSAGNCTPQTPSTYPADNLTFEVRDPAQAWNALTVGALTEKSEITERDYADWRPLAPPGDLCPSSSTSLTWKSPWPYKPELVLEGGNLAVDPTGTHLAALDSLRLLTTHHQPTRSLLDTFGDTSGAAALLARAAAQVWARCPDLWPETVRALLVHSADWTQAMLSRFPGGQRAAVERRLRVFGYGAPQLDRALWSARNALTLVVQETLQPFEQGRSKDMHVHKLPWPQHALQALGETQVTLRVTLSYFVEPNPARRGWTRRHRYASHGLRFDVQSPTESLKQFRARLNKAADDGDRGSSQASLWEFGPDLRSRGSVHTDRWRGTAADLAQRRHVAVYPVIGWWRERPEIDRSSRSVRYALVVSIETPPGTADIYTPVALMLDVRPLAVKTPITVG